MKDRLTRNLKNYIGMTNILNILNDAIDTILYIP